MALVWETAALATTLTLALLLWRFVRTRVPGGARLPLGPQGWPFIGDIATFLGNLTPQKAFSLSQTYGPVARVKAGFAEYIILNELDNIKRFLNHKDILCRCRSFAFSDSMDIGFARYEGKEWDENRRYSLKVLRNIGFGRGPMKEAFVEGSDSLVDRITEARGNPIDLTELLMASISDNMALFVFGQRHKFDDDDFSDLRTALRNEFIASRDPSALDSLPAFVTTVARMVPFTRAAHLLAYMKSIQEFVRCRLSAQLEACRDGQDHGFMGAYLTKCREADYDVKSKSTKLSMIGNAGSLVLAGSNTVTVVLTRLFLVLATHVDTVQRRIHQEIDSFTNGERRPTWEDRPSLPYTLATIWEVHRWSPLLAFGSPRRAYNDVVIGELFVPKGATIIANIWGVHNDPSYWIEPEKFDPSRFLRKDGSVAWKKVERVISFSVGKRMCPAKIFASVEIYTYLTRLMQKFLILPEEGTVFDPSIDSALLMVPKRHMFRCIPRTCPAAGAIN